MAEINYLTKESLEDLKNELNVLKTSGRAQIAEAIAEAREKGDLKENAEYDAAKEAQGLHEAKIAKLEAILANTRVLDTKDLDLSKVSVLTKVKITNLKVKKQMVYHLVSEKEADLKQGKISVTSPIGRGLLGKQVGEIAEITVPAGMIQLRVDEIFI